MQSKEAKMKQMVEFKVRTSQVRWLEQAYMSQNTDAAMAFWNDMCRTKVVRVNMAQLFWLIGKLEVKADTHNDNQEYADRNSALRFRQKCLKEFNKVAPFSENWSLQFDSDEYEAAYEDYTGVDAP